MRVQVPPPAPYQSVMGRNGMAAMNWECSYCGTFTTISDGDSTDDHAMLNLRSKHGAVKLRVFSVSCPNPNCRELSIDLVIRNFSHPAQRQMQWGSIVHQHRLWPEGKVMPLPVSIPEAIQKTYREAVLVLPVSGAASAALSRRCLQGIVRDYFEIPQNRRGDLGAELSFVKDKINSQVWDDIQAVRGVGDIGAHMDKNVDVIIDVDPNEAALLIGLIEELFKVWYIERDRRKEHSSQLKALLDGKRTQQKNAKIAAKVDPDSAAG